MDVKELLGIASLFALNNAKATIELKVQEDKRRRIAQLKIRKENLVNKIISKMGNNRSHSLEALLSQVLSCPDSEVDKFEQTFEEVYGRPRPQLQPPNLLDMLVSSRPQPQAPKIKEEEKKVSLTFKDLQRASNDNTCAICLDKYVDTDTVEIRHCAHTFHKKCLISWENSGRTNGKLCPCCRH
jgi:hypothetical protein